MTVFGIVLLVALILVGALLPLKYTARMHLPKLRPEPEAPGPAVSPGGMPPRPVVRPSSLAQGKEP